MSQKRDTQPVYQGERFTKAGRLLITCRQLMALNAFLDTPNGEVSSLAEWQRIVQRYDEYLHRDSVWRMPDSWVKTVSLGRRVGAVLNPRGREILGGGVPLHIHGFGHCASVKEYLRRRTQL